MNKENEENSNSLLHNKRRRNQYTIPYAIKQKLTLRLMDECFTDDLILISSKKANEMKKEEKSAQEPSNNTTTNPVSNTKDDEITDLLNEISEVGSEVELFAMERRKRRMIKLIEKMAEYIDESQIDIDELTNEFFLGNLTVKE